MKLNGIVGKILASENIDHFTTVEIRTAYLAIIDNPSMDPNGARRFVYCEIVKLVKKGWLRKSISLKKGLTTFIKTERFDKSAIVFQESKYEQDKQMSSTDTAETVNEKLINRLSQYKNELLSGLGEAEEYRLLYSQFPELSEKLQPKYNRVRELNMKLLGSIKAIENLTSDE